jgi:hypothetical protein
VGGWYFDAMKSFVPGISIVGEASGHYSLEQGSTGREEWTGLFAGVRRRWVTHSGANVFAQVLFGGWRYSQSWANYCGEARCREWTNSFWMTGLQPGIGVDVPLDSRWSVRARVDLRVGTTDDGGMGSWIVGGGINRFWGGR